MTAKRFLDLVGAICGLSILAIPFLVIALAIRLDTKGPVFFRQVRIGKNGKPFRIMKFRTMIVDAERIGGSLTKGRDARITAIGHILRKLKLDEFPQLWNVLLGEMSLVGPRPEVPEFVAEYSAEQMEVLEFKPGITDPSSIEYVDEERYLGSLEDPRQYYIDVLLPRKLKINLAYSREANICKDVCVILMTLLRIVNFAKRRQC